mmetsp:Transcript_29588/g.81309  ORF Transcript_29588/g.81309 Transcript_29588/m.81309 type:complete len:278 (+) Transcript_29588:879-1712(+)
MPRSGGDGSKCSCCIIRSSVRNKSTVVAIIILVILIRQRDLQAPPLHIGTQKQRLQICQSSPLARQTAVNRHPLQVQELQMGQVSQFGRQGAGPGGTPQGEAAELSQGAQLCRNIVRRLIVLPTRQLQRVEGGGERIEQVVVRGSSPIVVTITIIDAVTVITFIRVAHKRGDDGRKVVRGVQGAQQGQMGQQKDFGRQNTGQGLGAPRIVGSIVILTPQVQMEKGDCRGVVAIVVVIRGGGGSIVVILVFHSAVNAVATHFRIKRIDGMPVANGTIG